MICYRDMTFCDERGCVSFQDGSCQRALTKEVLRSADKWWNEGKKHKTKAPICTFAERPYCFIES